MHSRPALHVGKRTKNVKQLTWFGPGFLAAKINKIFGMAMLGTKTTVFARLPLRVASKFGGEDEVSYRV